MLRHTPRARSGRAAPQAALTVVFWPVNPLVVRLRSSIKRSIRYVQQRITPRSELATPYRQWHGPRVDIRFGLVVTPVADIVLLQGAAPEDAAVRVEFDDPQQTFIDASHRFPHPTRPSANRTCFEITIDGTSVPGATSCRAVTSSDIGEWKLLPRFPSPGSMSGKERITHCPACRSAAFTHAGRRQDLDMVTCTRCGLVMTSPRPIEDQTLLRYSERYFTEEYLPAQEATPALTAHIDSILDLAEPAKTISASLFELGIGGGSLLTRANERGWNASGTDVNPASVAHAKSCGLRARLENSDHAESLGGSYGAVISEMSLEHVRHPERFCQLAAEALVPGGRLVIYTVSAEGESFEHSGMASPLAGPAEHLFMFSAGSLVALCQRAGLRVESVWRNNTADEVGIVATKRRDIGNPAVMAPRHGQGSP